MGQATSKRRSYTPGNSVKASDSIVAKSSTRANGDTKSAGLANGSIEVRTSRGSDSAQIEADDTTSPTSVTSDTSTGRKENKRKRFRVSGLFSLKRTPSGKWPRRRKTTASAVNGTRPASCPEAPNDAEGVTSPARPQSLFLDELEIQEDDNKIETVDLSDHETDGKSKQKSGKAAGVDTPKAPPKTKGRRGSKKQSSLKKKKQEKKSSKKDKKNKSKHKASTSEAEDTATSGAEAEAHSPSVEKSELLKKVESVEAPEAAEELIPCLTASEERENSSSLATGLTQQVLAQIDAKSKGENVEEQADDAKKDTEGEDDLDAVASSIVAETMGIAQKRLSEESIRYGEDAAEVHASVSADKVDDQTSNDVEKLVVDVAAEHKGVVAEEIISASTDVQVESPPPVVEAFINPSAQKMQESTPSPQAPPRRRHSATQSTDIQLSKSLAVEVQEECKIAVSHSSETEPTAEIEGLSKTPETTAEPTSVEETSSIKATVIEKVEGQIQQLIPQVSVEPQILGAASLSTEDEIQQTPKEETDDKESSEDTLETQHFNEAAVDVGAEIAAVSATVVAIESEAVKSGTDDLNDTQKEKVKTASVSSDSDKQSKSDANEKKRLEKEKLKKEKEAEKAKEKERIKEEKRKKAEQKSAEKEKHKSDKKIKIPKRLSSLFHRKDKQLKQVEEASIEVDSPSTSSAVAAEQTKEAEKLEENSPQTVDTMVCPVDQAVVEVPAEDGCPSLEIPSLTVDASVEPLSITTNLETNDSCPESQPANEDASSAPPESPLESPLSDETKSPGSDYSEPTSPGSDYDANGSSGGSNVLKKISLGPRLRTAILRKKSSGASDKVAERVSLTTPKSVAESTDVTPPPRKLRPRKPVEQYSPVTLGAHNLVAPDVVAEVSNQIKTDDINGLKDSVANEIKENGDMLTEHVPVEISAAASDLKTEDIPCVDNDAAEISTDIQSDLPKAELETESVEIKTSIVDNRVTPEVESSVVEETSVMNTVLNNVTNKLQSTPSATTSEDSPIDETIQLSVIPQTCSSNIQCETSEKTLVNEPSEVVEEIIEATTKTRISCEPFKHLEMTSDIVSDSAVDIKDSSDTDDTDPSQLQLPSNPRHHEQQQQSEQQHQQHSEGDDGVEESEMLSSLPSPTVVSTATIVLRPSSVDDTCPEAETSLEEWIVPDVKKVKTTSTSVQTEYAKNSIAVTSDSVSNAELTVQKLEDSLSSPPKADGDETETSPEESTGNFDLSHEVQSLVASDQLSGKETVANGDGDLMSGLKDVLNIDQDSGEVQNGHVEKQVYTAVCMAQVRDEATKEEPVAEEVIVASSKPKPVATIAEYLIGTFEEEPEKEVTTAGVEESGEDAKEINSLPSQLPGEVAGAADSFFVDDGTQSADITITEDTPGCVLESAANDQSSNNSSEDSGDSGQQTPTPSNQHETVDSVINGIVNEAVNGVLHGEHLEKADESMESEKSPPSSPTADDSDSNKVIRVETSLVTDLSLPSVDDNKNATKSDDNDDLNKDKCNMKETIIKPSPTETIEAYLKLQYQEAGENISTPFVNGEKGFEENGNVLISPPETTSEIVSAGQTEQEMTG